MMQIDESTPSPKIYEVKQGDCLLSIAALTGRFWKSIWEDPANAELKDMRKDPTVLLPGDRLSIRPVRPRDEQCETDRRHQFVRKGIPAKLRLRLHEDGEPLKRQPFRLEVGSKIHSGTTDGEGMIEVSIPPKAISGTLTVGVPPRVRRYRLNLGHLDPVDEVRGLQSRLANLGYGPGPVDNRMGDNTVDAVRRFQLANRLQDTGQLDGDAKEQLKGFHGS